MSFPLEQRGSPEDLPLLRRAPRSANRIASSGDSSAVRLLEISSPCYNARVTEFQLQSFNDSIPSMIDACPGLVLPWSFISCRADVCDSVDALSSNCLCRQSDLPFGSSCSRPTRPRAQCSRKLVREEGRKCRHTACQRVSKVDSELKPVMPLNVIGFLHRALRIVCGSCNAYRDSGPSANGFKCITCRRRHHGKCNLQIKFSLQRFCSAVLFGLLLATALRPQSSMAAPVPSGEFSVSEENHDARSSPPGIDETLKNLDVAIHLTLGHYKTMIHNQYCKDVFYLGKDCPHYNIDMGALKITPVPKNITAEDEEELFDTEEKKDKALINIVRNFEAYIIHLEELKKNHIPDEKSLAHEYGVLKEHIKQVYGVLLDLIKLRGLKTLPSPTLSDSELASVHKTDTSSARAMHWGVLSEVISGVEYFRHLIPYLSPLQSTKL